MFDEAFTIVKKIMLIIFSIWLGCIVIAKISDPKPDDNKSSCYWTNIDPNRSVQYITDYDVENRKVIYEDGGYYDKPIMQKVTPYSNPSGITIRSGNTVIQTDVSPEELLESMDLDYNDILDYYGVELR